MKRERNELEDEHGEVPVVAGQEQHGCKRPKKKLDKPGFDKRMFEETNSYVQDGLRHIKPYHFTFTTHCKGRWFGRTLIEVFSKEFRMESPEYYQAAVKTGKITVDGEIVEPNTVLKQNQVIRTNIHRHEPPVINNQIEFIENDDDIVVINKPASIPVHPCGRYRHNTIVFILGEEYGLTNLHTIHRIDRLTSGILMFAKTVKKAQEMEKFVKGRLVEKVYLCRVAGKFPEKKTVCSEPIMVVSHKVGVCQVKPEGKEAKTEFEFMSYNGKSSLVKCTPHTGRMHQIRVHLQFLGYPIINDPIYNKPEVWGKGNGKDGTNKSVNEILTALEKARKDSILRSRRLSDSHLEVSAKSANEGTDQNNDEKDSDTLQDQNLEDITKCENINSFSSYDKECSECKNPIPDPGPNELCIYLHALSYKGPGWEYKTRLPVWASDN